MAHGDASKVERVIVVAPHPDDETLGCGGTLLRHAARGDEVHWLIVTDMREVHGFTGEQVERRGSEIAQVASAYGFRAVHNLALPPAGLDRHPMGELIAAIGAVFREVEPTTLYLPYRADAHSDHAFVFDAAAACTKWFRYPSVRRVLVYETLSETDFGLTSPAAGFSPNSFVDITGFLTEKLRIAALFASEMGEFPFPRSTEALRALAAVRGAASGFKAAESFMLLRERVG
jgi:N-acetylglucosamine malate deacetylase 1